MAPRPKQTAASDKSPKSKPLIKVTKSAIPTPTGKTLSTAILPLRTHSVSYHFPLLLNDRLSCDALLNWFSSVEETRSMPWRKAWLDAKDFDGREKEFGEALGRRAYEVWVSEVMLQQTRVTTVISYFNNWISKWPTVQDLAAADHEDVLAAWKGLGYYSRATRLHEGAKVMVKKPASGSCLLPSQAVDLQKIPGIGRYTAGAVSSIAFGEAEPVLDGNVARVLSRQLGLHMDAKDKKASDILWEEADRLIKHVSANPDASTSAIPGQWNQALMELGSTICTPRPQCDMCPIQATCRAYSEGQALLTIRHQSPREVEDIEDACTLCDTIDIEDLALTTDNTDAVEAPKMTKKRKTSTKQNNKISSYFSSGTPAAGLAGTDEEMQDAVQNLGLAGSRKRKPSTQDLMQEHDTKQIATYCSLFPKKVAKKKATEQECVVCIIQMRSSHGKSKWLIEQRPAKGLLASLWQFPQSTLSASTNTPASRQDAASKYVSGLRVGRIDMKGARSVAHFPPLVHVFTHIRLTMHVHQFEVSGNNTEDVDEDDAGPPTRRFVEGAAMGQQTLSTGMRKCWDLIAKVE